jgi:hypothetical protein
LFFFPFFFFDWTNGKNSQNPLKTVSNRPPTKKLRQMKICEPNKEGMKEIMTTINVTRYANGRTIYDCRNSAYPPTNPRLGLKGNTVYWNERTRETTVVVPRQQEDYFSQSATQLTSRYFQKLPTTQERLPAINARSQSKDLYGRTAPVTLERSKFPTDVSRYSTSTNIVLYAIAPEGKLSSIPNKSVASVQYSSQYPTSYSNHFITKK